VSTSVIHGGASGFAPPPFVARPGRKRPKRGWWSGLNGHGKLAVYASACLILALIAVLVFSAGDGNGAVQSRRKPAPGKTSLTTIVNAFTGTFGALRLLTFSNRLQAILTGLSTSAPALERKLSELSRVVQGARCQGYLAEVLQLSDAGGLHPAVNVARVSDGPVPEDPEGIWRYANDLADSYVPPFKESLAQLESAWHGLTAVGLPAPLSSPNDLLLGSCDLQLKAMRQCIQGLEVVRNCDEMTVGQACELVQDAVAKINEARAWLSRADDALSRAGQPLSLGGRP
jgi:hypothetical protein